LFALAAVFLSGCWFQPGWGPGRSGFNPVEDRLTVANVADLTLVWSTDVGADAVLDPITSVHGVHVMSGANLTTMRLDDGAVRWSVVASSMAPGDTIGSPSLWSGLLLVPTTRLDGATFQENLAFDPASGVFAGTEGIFGGIGSITVDGDAYAGSTIRTRSTDIADSWVYLWNQGENSWLNLVDSSSDGSPLPRLTTPAVGDDRVMVGRETDVLAYARRRPFCGGTGCPPVWTHTLGGTATVPVIDDATTTVYVADSSGGVAALSTVDGTVRWTADLGGTRGVTAPPTLGNGRLHVTSTDGRLYTFAAGGCGAAVCNPLWQATTGGAVEEQAALAGGVLHVASVNGTLSAFDAAGCGAATCPPLWTASTGSRVTGAPIVANGYLVVGTGDGRVIAYRPT
jgi:hypothetical protein